MAQKVQIDLISDLALREDPDSTVPAHRTARVSLDGEAFELDLSDAEYEGLAEKLRPYREAGRKVAAGGVPRTRAPRAHRETIDTTVIRIWARENGYEIKDRGRVPAELVAKYQAAVGS